MEYIFSQHLGQSAVTLVSSVDDVPQLVKYSNRADFGGTN